MKILKWYRRVASRAFSSVVEKNLKSFSSLHSDIKKANMRYLLRDYLSTAFFTSIVLFGFVFIIAFPILFWKLTFGSAFFISFFSAMTLSVISFFIFIEYPSIKAADRKRSIDNNLPFAVLYMNTIAGTGSPPYAMFKLLSNFQEYGEVSVEAQEIIEDMDVMGQDIEVALQRAAENSPSEEFKDLLWSMVTTIVRGGDMRSLLTTKADALMATHRRRLKEYTNNLTMYVEVYITLVIVGSIFGIVMSTIMGAISGFAGLRLIQQVLVYFFLPLASVFFLMLLKLTSPLS
jgi:flagellar protein FlaJ